MIGDVDGLIFYFIVFECVKSLHAGIRTQVLAGISSGLSVNEVKDPVTEHQPKEFYRHHAFSVGNDSSFSNEYRMSRNKLFCVIITSGRGGAL